MIINTDTGASVDTADLTAEERHIIQKLLAWKSLVTSVEQFRRKKADALAAGWNNSGPVRETRALALAAGQMEKELLARLKG